MRRKKAYFQTVRGQKYILSTAYKCVLCKGETFSPCGLQGSISPVLLSSCIIEFSLLDSANQKRQVKFCVPLKLVLTNLSNIHQ